MELSTTLQSQRFQDHIREVGINQDCWYPVGWANQLQPGQLVPVTVWQEAIALYRSLGFQDDERRPETESGADREVQMRLALYENAKKTTKNRDEADQGSPSSRPLVSAKKRFFLMFISIIIK